MKKFLAILLTVCLLASMFTFAASAAEAPLTITGATIISDTQIAYHFSEAINPASVDGTYLSISLRTPDNSDVAVRHDVVSNSKVTVSADRKTVFANSTDLINMFNRTGSWESYAQGYEIIAALDVNMTIKSFDGTKTISSNGTLTYPAPHSTYAVHYTDNVVYDANYAQSTDFCITGANILDEHHVAIHFSEPVVLDAPNYGTWFFGYIDANGVRTYRNNHHQVGAIWPNYVSTDLKTVVLEVNSAFNLYDMLNCTGDYASYAGQSFVVGADDLTHQWQGGYKGGITEIHPVSSPTTNMHADYFMSNGGEGEGTWTSYTKNVISDENYLYPNPSDEDLQLTEAIIINDNQLIAHFSEPIAVIEPWTVTYKMVYINSNNAITEEYYLSAAVIGDMSTMRLDLAGTDKTMAEIINDEAHTEDELWFVIEEVLDNGDKLCGGVEKIEALATPGKQLAATVTKLNGPDSAWIPVAVDMDYMLPMDADVSEEFHIVSATAINDKQIVIEMSEPVHMETPYAYIALRYTDESGYLMMDGATPLQFDGASVISGDGMRITWTINETGNIADCNNVLDAINFKGDLAKYKNYRAMMCIEEIVDNPDDNATVSHVFNDAGKELAANRIYDIGRDAAYVRVVENTKWEDPGLLPLEVPAMPKGPHIVKAVAVNDKQLVVEFSEPITFIEPYGFMAIRYVDRNFNLGFDGKEPLQFYGAAVVSLDRKSVVWTLADEGNIAGADNLADILNRTGKLSKYKDYYPVFGLEEIIDGKDKDSLIENVINDNGEKLVANCPSDIGRDRVYVNISVDTKYQIPDTSDNVNVYLLCAGLAVSVILAGAVVIKKKRTQA